MFRPGGYSSEDSEDEFENYDMYFKSDDKRPKKQETILTDTERHELMLQELSQFAFSGKVQPVLNYLDEGGINVNIELKDNWKLLMIAASMGNDELSLELIKRGADVNQNRDEYTVLMAACACPIATSPYENSFKVVEELVKRKADVNAKSRKRKTALMCAASSGNIYAVELLLPICNKYDEDNQGWSALFWAVNDNHAEVLNLLLEQGLSCDKYDVRRLKPIDYAKEADHRDVISLLPDPDRNIYDDLILDTHYTFNQEMITKKFQQEVYLMLKGMRCQELIKKFVEMDINLYKFLTLTKEDLIKMGIVRPYQQNRILGGLYRFHKHPYKGKSLPNVFQEEICTSIDAGRALISALRHMITMQAAIKYLHLNMERGENQTELLNHISKIEVGAKLIENSLNSVRNHTIQWNKENNPVDLINDQWMKNSNRKRLFTFVSTAVITIIFIKIKFC